ncbi:serine carboxypeptidase-like 2 [Prunus dulcis]|uniref:Serine carboxypeptidase-like 2 n=1 Tax=Prunus dulcis TaxID=3755 RepID=A0A5H2XN54_PRUDU|nr:serine carboxypeptidase-like 2 [Prunus dulcis]
MVSCSTQFDSKTDFANLRRLISFTRASMAFFTPRFETHNTRSPSIRPSTSKSIITMLPLALLLVFLNSHIIVASKSTIDTLPGFSGELPFKLETGYVGVGDLDDVQLFYYFIESERSPKEDPLVLWLTGGPGCSGFSGLAYQIGPIMFNYANSSGNEPTLVLNPYSWTKVANIIFLDQPVGSGFSYAKSWQGYETGDISSAAHTYEFLRKWLKDHPEFLKNPLYIAGDSYSGITVPIVVQEVSNGNEVGHEPPLNLKSTKTNCKGEYVQVDPSNAPCVENLQEVTEPYNYLFSFIWANDKTVQNALHVREGTIKGWEKCNQSLSSNYAHDVRTSIDYHRNLTKKTLEHWFTGTPMHIQRKLQFDICDCKGGGHTAPEFKPMECHAMIDSSRIQVLDVAAGTALVNRFQEYCQLDICSTS